MTQVAKDNAWFRSISVYGVRLQASGFRLFEGYICKEYKEQVGKGSI